MARGHVSHHRPRQPVSGPGARAAAAFMIYTMEKMYFGNVAGKARDRVCLLTHPSRKGSRRPRKVRDNGRECGAILLQIPINVFQ